MEGWVKLHRNILKWRWFKDHKTFKLWVTLLLKASVTDSEFLDENLKAGDLITSYDSLSEATGLTVKEVRTCLQKLVKTGCVLQENKSRFQIITILNWRSYQAGVGLGGFEEGAEGRQRAGNGQAIGRQRAGNGQAKGNIQEDKEFEEFKEFKEDKVMAGLLAEYESFLRGEGVKVDTRCKKALREELIRISPYNQVRAEALRESLKRGWKWVYRPDKPQVKKSGFNNFTQAPSDYDEIDRRSYEKLVRLARGKDADKK